MKSAVTKCYHAVGLSYLIDNAGNTIRQLVTMAW